MELGALVAEALLASAQGAEVLGGLGDNIVEEIEVDATGLLLDGAGGGDVALGVDLDLGAPGEMRSATRRSQCGAVTTYSHSQSNCRRRLATAAEGARVWATYENLDSHVC